MFRAITRSLRTKLILAFVLAMLIPVVVIATYTDRNTTNFLIERAREDETKNVADTAATIVQALTNAKNNSLFLSATSGTKDYANLVGGRVAITDQTAKVITQAQNALFRSFLTNVGTGYRKIFVLDSNGHLALGIDNSRGALTRMAPDNAVDYSDQPYFSQAIGLVDTQVYVSNLELSKSKGKLEEPYTPILYYSTPLFDDFKVTAGVLVFELDLSSTFAALTEQSPDDQFLLVDSDSSYLFHSDPDKLYGRILGSDQLFSKDQPADSKTVLGQTSGNIFGSPERPELLQTFTRIAPTDQPAITWYLIHQRSLKSILGTVTESRVSVAVLSGGLLILALVFAGFLVRSIVEPIRSLSSTAQAIVVGDMTKHAEVNSKDEVGQLAAAFNEMIDAIQKREADLRNQAQELRKARDEAVAATRLAQENTRLKSEFLSTMSHELRTPLNAIEGFTGIILNKMGGTNFNEKTEDFLNRIRSNSKRLLQLINDFLDLSRIESGRLELASQPFSPVKLARRWEDEISVLAEKKGVQFEVNLGSTLPEMIYGDEEAISKVAINLLGNAIKFTEVGQVKLAVERNDGKWEIIVEDTGIGIPPHARDFIFEEFRQVDQTSKRKYGGTGLGLAIVQKYTRAMGGSVNVKSELGKGSIFTVTLPCKVSLQPEPEGNL